jgi:hypothetical protein
MISYHFYASPTKEQTMENWQYTFFDQADRFLTSIRYIESIRKRLSPQTQTDLDEIGSILPTDWHPDTPYDPGPPIQPDYWNASAAVYAYLYLESAKLGIDIVGESQLVGFPSQFPSVTMVDWQTGKPNARFSVLQLLHDHLKPGATLVETKLIPKDIDALAFEDSSGRHILLVNKRHRSMQVALPSEFHTGTVSFVATGSQSLQKASVPPTGTLQLDPFGVVIVDAPHHASR